MKRQTVLASISIDYGVVDGLLGEGWILDPAMTDGKPYRLDNATVWPLIFYEDEDVKPVEARKPGEFDDVEAVVDVSHGDVEAKVKENYVVHEIYQKNVIMVKRKVKEAEK